MKNNKKTLLKILKTRLKYLRKQMGLTMMQLANATGLSPSSIQRWENGGKINSKNLIVLAKFFGVTTDYLLGLKDY